MLAAQIIATVALVVALVVLFRIHRASDGAQRTRAIVVLAAALTFLIYTLMRGH